jgi:NADPH2:quinone reductase
MKAIVVEQFGGPEVLQYKDVPNPQPNAQQVLVRIRAVGINPYEAYQREGWYPTKPNLPYTPGADAAGVVEQVGSEVKNWRKGDRVYLTGALSGVYAEFALCSTGHLHPLPERISFAQGAALNVPYGTAYRALFDRIQTRPGESVLVHGATGGVGIAAVQMAVAHGCVVIGTGGSEAGREVVRKQGAAYAFDHGDPAYVDQIMNATQGKGVDVIIEMLANQNLDRDLGLLARGGRVVVVGSRGPVEIDARQTFGKESAILGMSYFSGGPVAVAEAHAYIVAGLRSGSLTPVVGQELPLAEASKAHREIMESKARGKIVLVP